MVNGYVMVMDESFLAFIAIILMNHRRFMIVISSCHRNGDMIFPDENMVGIGWEYNNYGISSGYFGDILVEQ